MDEWLAQIGLKGRALASAIRSCEDNFVDDVSTLRGLAEGDKESFCDVFPQGVIRSAIRKALSGGHTKAQEQPTEHTREAKKHTDNG